MLGDDSMPPYGAGGTRANCDTQPKGGAAGSDSDLFNKQQPSAKLEVITPYVLRIQRKIIYEVRTE
jgi:hypothetical protein